MTSTIVLSTSLDKEIVYEVVKKVGFREPSRNGQPYTHGTVDDLALQIHPKEKAIIMEFDDLSNNFPNNPKAVQILKILYEGLPDIKYGEYSIPIESPKEPLSLLLSTLE